MSVVSLSARGLGQPSVIIAPAFEEDFQEYPSVASFLSYNSVTNPRSGGAIWQGVFAANTGLISLDTSIAYSGYAQSIRYDYPASSYPTEDYQICMGTWQFPGAGFPAGCAYNNISPAWVEIVARFSSTFQTWNPNFTAGFGGGIGCGSCGTGGLPVQPDFKFIFLEAQSPYYNGSNTDRVELLVGHENGQAGAWGPLVPGTLQDSTDNTGMWNFQYGTNPTSLSGPAGVWDDTFHVYRLYYKAPASWASNDGEYKAWIDYNLVSSHIGIIPNSSNTLTNGYGVWGIQMSANVNEGIYQNSSMWIQRYRVWTRNPGW